MQSPFGKTWVCTLCGQGVTRRTSARRHNDRLHNGQAIIARPFEYIMGRLEGRFHSPRDPLEYRRRSSIGHYHDYSANIAHDNRHGTSNGAPLSPNYDAAAAASHFYTSSSPFRADSVNDSFSQERQFKTTQKLQEYNFLLNKLQSKGYIPSDVAKMYSVGMYNNVQSGHLDILDQNLGIIRGWKKSLAN
jgi:hypothetical protein